MSSMNEAVWRKGLSSIEHRAAIAHELYTILENLGADTQVLAVIRSYGDTLDDAEILQLLKNFNETDKVLKG